MKFLKNILLWCLAAFLLLGGLVYLPQLCGFLLLAAGALVLPISRWQEALKKGLPGGLKVILAVALILFGFSMVPQPEVPEQPAGGSTTEAATVHTSPRDTVHTAETTLPSVPQTAPSEPPVTEPPATEPPVTEPPATEPPATKPPVTEPPVTEPPVTEPPVTEPQETVHQHSWTQATCTQPAACTSCGETKGTAADHQWVSATCTQPQYCQTCGKTQNEAYGHSYENGVCIFCGEKTAASGQMVWIPTHGGTKYHSRESCSNMKNPRHVTLSEAIALGFTACKRCH